MQEEISGSTSVLFDFEYSSFPLFFYVINLRNYQHDFEFCDRY